MNKVILLGAVGAGAFALMSFGKKAKTPETAVIPQPTINPGTITPQPTINPGTITPQPAIIPETIVPQPVFVPDIIAEPFVQPQIPIVVAPPVIPYVEPIQYIEPDKQLKIEIIEKISNTFINSKTQLVLDLKFTNYTEDIISLKEIGKLKVQKADGSKTYGLVPVSFNDIKLGQNQYVILKDVVLGGLENDTFTFYATNFKTLVSITPIYKVVDDTIVVEAPATLVSEEFLVKDANILATLDFKNDPYGKYVNGHLEIDYNIKIENNTDEDFYLNTIKAIAIFYFVSNNWKYISQTPMNMANIKLPAHEQVILQNVILKVPYDTWGKFVASVLNDSLNTNLKIQLLS